MLRRRRLPVLALALGLEAACVTSTDAEAAVSRAVCHDGAAVRLFVEVEPASVERNTYHLRVFVENRTDRKVDVVGSVTYSFRIRDRIVFRTLNLRRYVAPGKHTAWKPGSFRDLVVHEATLESVTLR
jgi:hypothetical protein